MRKIQGATASMSQNGTSGKLMKYQCAKAQARVTKVTKGYKKKCNPCNPKFEVCNPEKSEVLRWFEGDLTFSVFEAATLTKINRINIYKACDPTKTNSLKTIKVAGKTRIYAESLFERYPQAAENYKAEIERQNSLTVNANEAAIAQEEASRAEAKAKERSNAPIKTDIGAARAWHIQTFQQFWKSKGYPKNRCLSLYIVGFIEGAIEAPDWVRAFYREGFDERTFLRWEADMKGPKGLDPGYKGNPNSHWTRHPEQARFIESLFLQRPDTSKKKLWEGIKATFKKDYPSERTVSRWVDNYREKNAQAVLMAINPDAAKSAYQVAFGSRSRHVKRLNQLWELDGTPIDLMFPCDPKRYKGLFVVDVYSGRVVFLLWETESSQAVGQLLFKAIDRLGLPEQIKTDNGKAFTSKAATRLYADMEVEHILCAPFSGEQKPHVERTIGHFMRDLVPLHGGFKGHNVAQAQAIRSRKTFAQRLKEGDYFETGVSKEEFEVFADNWCLAENHRIRKDGRLKGKSPMDVVNEWAAQHKIRRVKDINQLIHLLVPPIPKAVGKKGIKHNHYYYIAPELGDLVGREVEIRPSPNTPGRIAVFYQNKFICLAVESQLEGIDQAEVAAKARARQQAANKLTRTYQRAIKKLVNPQAVIEAILEDRMAGGNTVQVLQRSDQISTNSAEAAIATKAAEELAVKVRTAKAPIEDPLGFTEAEQKLADKASGKKPLEDPAERFFAIDDSVKRGEAVSEKDQEFYNNFLKANPRFVRLRKQQPPVAQVG